MDTRMLLASCTGALLLSACGGEPLAESIHDAPASQDLLAPPDFRFCFLPPPILCLVPATISLYVTAGTACGGDGSSSRPLGTISAAMSVIAQSGRNRSFGVPLRPGAYGGTAHSALAG